MDLCVLVPELVRLEYMVLLFVCEPLWNWSSTQQKTGEKYSGIHHPSSPAEPTMTRASEWFHSPDIWSLRIPQLVSPTVAVPESPHRSGSMLEWGAGDFGNLIRASSAIQLCDALLGPLGQSLILLLKEGDDGHYSWFIAQEVYRGGCAGSSLSISMIWLCDLG